MFIYLSSNAFMMERNNTFMILEQGTMHSCWKGTIFMICNKEQDGGNAKQRFLMKAKSKTSTCIFVLTVRVHTYDAYCTM
jgi:hypothetical protein